ncbi:MAG: DUF2339 domain-containing protein, partial [Planctomycetaceae bacterium]|nr:DUF2339 domain-containing protein [Planctomycetaceae bacterium]
SVVCHLPSLYWQAAPSAAVVIALGFVAIGIPLQFDAMWITLGWLTVFAGLWYFGHRQTNLTFVVMAYIFFGLGTVRLVTEIAGQLREVKTQLEMCAVFNTIALPMLASAAVLVAVAVLKAADDRRQTTAEKNSVVCCLPSVVFGILGYILLGIILSGEAARYFYAHPELWFYNPGNPLVWAPYPPEYLLEAFLTAFWFAWAILLLEIGFIFRSRGITTTAIVGLGLAVTIMLFVGFAQRVEYQDAINNPFCVALTAGSLILLALGYQSKHVLRRFDATYQNAFGLFGVVGLFTLIATLSIEWIDFTRCDIMPMAYAIKFLSALWALYALFWIGLGFFVRNLPIRICGLIVLFGALAKTVLYDAGITQPFQLGWVTPLMNAYFISMLFPVIPALVLAVWTNRCRLSYMGNQERIAWKVSGVIALLALLIYLSVECYHNFDVAQTKHGHFTIKYAGSAALTTLWSVFALILTTLALVFRSKVLRIISMSILLLTALKVFGDLPFRPEFTVPFWNPFSRPMMILAATILALGIFWVHHLDENSTERKIYRFFAFFGVCFLWLTMSVECFQSVRQLAGAGQEAWKAQMALSILWSLFAGVLIGIGFVWRSATLRWMAILLFAATLLKILIVDMSGVNELYRFGAVFALASLLMAATWAYQRFKPEA